MYMYVSMWVMNCSVTAACTIYTFVECVCACIHIHIQTHIHVFLHVEYNYVCTVIICVCVCTIHTHMYTRIHNCTFSVNLFCSILYVNVFLLCNKKRNSNFFFSNLKYKQINKNLFFKKSIKKDFSSCLELCICTCTHMNTYIHNFNIASWNSNMHQCQECMFIHRYT
jgi:hypothetical protein